MKTRAQLLVLFLLFTALTACFQKKVNINGPETTQIRNISGFDVVKTAGSLDIEIVQGDYEVKIEAPEDLMPYLITEKEGNTLIIKLKSNINYLINGADPKIYVQLPSLEKAATAGSGNVRIVGNAQWTKPIEISSAGSGDIQFEGRAPSITAKLAGSGNFNAEGETRSLTIQIAGSGDANCNTLMAEETKVKIAGSGNAKVHASIQLDVKIAGSGDVIYSGEPAITSSINGSGEVKAFRPNS